MPIKGICFDLYGTLMVYGDMQRAWDDWLRAMHTALIENGITTSLDEFSALCDGFFSRDEPPDLGDGLTVFERRIAMLAQSLDLDLSHQIITAIAEAGLAAWHEYVTCDDDALEVLRQLSLSHKLALVTNFDHPPHLHAMLPDLGLVEHFDAVVISGEVGVRKPDPTIFEIALDRLGLDRGEVIHVGDSLEDDLEGARAAGIRCVLIDRTDGRPDRSAADFQAQGVNAATADGHSLSEHVPTIRNLGELLDKPWGV